MRSVAALAAAFAAAAPWMAPRRAERRRWRIPVPALIAGAGIGVLSWGAATTLGAPPAVAVAAGVLVTPLPVSARRARLRRSRAAAAGRWPDFLAAVRSRVAGGAPLPDATRAAGRHIGGPFADLDVGLGLGFETLMAEMRGRWQDPIADRVFTTLETATSIGGGHVDSILATLADSIAGELRMRSAHDAALTQQRMTAAVALAAPWAILCLSLATNPTASEAFSTPTGTVVIAGGVAATAIGYALSVRTARLADAPRLFR
jgi:tight adherence protein B